MFRARLEELQLRVERIAGTDGTHATDVGLLTLYRASAPTDPVATVYEPALCAIAWGRKRVMLADEVYDYDPAHFLLVSVDLPLVGQVVQASPEEPYLSLRTDLDLGQVGELLMDADLPSPHPVPRAGAVRRARSMPCCSRR